jgi:hypothetical protein
MANDKKTLISHGSTAAAALVAGLLAAVGGSPKAAPSTRKPRTHVPMMVTSSRVEIAAWNDAVRPRNKKRHLEKPKRTYATGQHPKFPKDRVHKQHKHPLRDEHGAYTLVGRAPIAQHAPDNIKQHMPRRMWLAGISAQRGY